MKLVKLSLLVLFITLVSTRPLNSEFSSCPICLENLLYKNGIVVFTNSSSGSIKRTCEHAICAKCAETLATFKCPLDRHEFTDFKMINKRDVYALYNLLDLDYDSRLNKRDIQKAFPLLKTYHPVNVDLYVNENWGHWDVDNDGYLDINEFRRFGIIMKFNYSLKTVDRVFRRRAVGNTGRSDAISDAIFINHFMGA